MSLRMIICLLSLFAFAAPLAAAAPAPQAGFERIVTADGTEVGIWYPAEGIASPRRFGLYAADVVTGAAIPAGPHPLVVISHGAGGDYAGHVDTAVALARAGVIVASLTHPGDNWRDRSRTTDVEARPKALSGLINYMLSTWTGRASIDPDRIGAFGFSSGGFTVLAAAGGRPDLSRIAGHCAANAAFFDCTLMGARSRGAAAPTWPDQRDVRIKSLVVLAPALGFTFDRGLAQVTLPVQLWRAGEDRILPAPLYADAVRAALPRKPEFRIAPGAGHFDFLAPCVDPVAMPAICTSAAGFDRRAFHKRLNAAVVRFFRKTLGVK